MTKAKTLTPKQQLFVSEYLIDRNATQAAIRAGYSEKTASQMAYKLLNDERVKAQVAKKQDGVMRRNDITVDDILAELEDARKVGKVEGAASAMVAATMGKAKILGLLVDKVESKTEGNISIDIAFD